MKNNIKNKLMLIVLASTLSLGNVWASELEVLIERQAEELRVAEEERMAAEAETAAKEEAAKAPRGSANLAGAMGERSEKGSIANAIKKGPGVASAASEMERKALAKRLAQEAAGTTAAGTTAAETAAAETAAAGAEQAVTKEAEGVGATAAEKAAFKKKMMLGGLGLAGAGAVAYGGYKALTPGNKSANFNTIGQATGLTIVNNSPWAINYGAYVVQQCDGAGQSAPIQLVPNALAVGGTATSTYFKNCSGSIYIGTDGNGAVPAQYFRVDAVDIPVGITTGTLVIDSVNGQLSIKFNNDTDQVYVASGITSIPLTPEAAAAAVAEESPDQAAADAIAHAAATDQVASDAAAAAAVAAAADARANPTPDAQAVAVEAAKAAAAAQAAAARSAETARALAREITGSKMGVQHAQAFVKAAKAKLNVDNGKVAAINKRKASVVRNKALAAAKHAATLASNVVAKAGALLKAYQAIDKAKPNASKATLDTLAAAAMKAEEAYKKALAQK